MAMTETLPVWLQAIAAVLLVLGGAFMLVGAIGLVRLPDFFMRLHAPTKATTLGVGGVLLASMLVAAWRGQPWLQALLVTLFLFVTAPVSAKLLAQAALHLKAASRAGEPPAAPSPSPATSGEAAAAPEPTVRG